MSEIKKHNPAEAEALDSREVAEMIEKKHFNLLRDINGYIQEMEGIGELKNEFSSQATKIDPSDFFIPSSYTSDQGKKLPCFLITKRGCEFVANKLTGEKGTKFTALYVTRFNIMEEQEKQQAVKGKAAKTPQELAAADKRATAMMLNAKSRIAASLQKLYDRAGVKAEYQALAISDFYSSDGVVLPRIALQGTKITYDKNTIAKRLGVYSKSSGGKTPHAQAIGAIIGELEIGEDEREAVPYCRNGHDGTDYQYTDSVIDKVRNWLVQNGWPSPLIAGGKKYGTVYRDSTEVRDAS